MPKVFISYSWDDENHKNWILTFANRLVRDGVDILLDRYELRLGQNLPTFVEGAIHDSDFIIIVFTPNYKAKADGRAGGVGYEYSIVNNGLYRNIANQTKVLPVIRVGSMFESIPDFMQQYIHFDFRNDDEFESIYEALLREIYNEPAIQKPQIGNKPNFGKLDDLPDDDSFKLQLLPISDRIEIATSPRIWMIKDYVAHTRTFFSSNPNGHKGIERHPFYYITQPGVLPCFKDHRLKIKGKNGKYGFINPDGDLIIPFVYDDADDFSENLAAVKKQDKWGFIDTDGKIRLDFDYEELSSPDRGLVFNKKYGAWSICDIYGNYLISKSFENDSQVINYYFDCLNSLFAQCYPTLVDLYDTPTENYRFRLGILATYYGSQRLTNKEPDDEYKMLEKAITDNDDYAFLKTHLEDAARKLFTKEMLFDLRNTVKMTINEHGGLYGASEENGNVIYKEIFQQMLPFDYNRSFVRLYSADPNKWSIVDVEGNILCEGDE